MTNTPLPLFEESIPRFAEDPARLTEMVIALGAEVFALKVEAAVVARALAADPALAARLDAIRDSAEFRAWFAAEETDFTANLLDPLAAARHGTGEPNHG